MLFGEADPLCPTRQPIFLPPREEALINQSNCIVLMLQPAWLTVQARLSRAGTVCVLSPHNLETVYLVGSQSPRQASCEGALPSSCRSVAIVSLNGSILGVHRAPEKLVRGFRAARRAGGIGGFVSVYRQAGAVHIASDGGRVCRPLIVCEGGAPKVTAEHTAKVGAISLACLAVSAARHRRPCSWAQSVLLESLLRCRPRNYRYSCLNGAVLLQLKQGIWGFEDFLRNGLVEYLDVNEEDNALIALYEENIGVYLALH